MTAGIILSGGASQRMGRTKALLRDRFGVRFIDRVADAFAPVLEPVVEVGGGFSRGDAVIDRSFGGPARATWLGISKIFADRAFDATIVAACDLPRLSTLEVEWLASMSGESSVVPVVAGRARFDFVLLGRAAIAAMLTEPPDPGAAMSTLFEPRLTQFIDVHLTGRAHAMADCDTPEEYEALLR
ncbi:MAG: NTP transferase domain-containing protein [Acidimicrobiales bacterium]